MQRRRNHIVRTEQTEALDYLFWTKVNTFTYCNGAYILNFTYPVTAKAVKQLCGCTDIEPITTDKALELIPLQPMVDMDTMEIRKPIVWIQAQAEQKSKYSSVTEPEKQKPEQPNIKDMSKDTVQGAMEPMDALDMEQKPVPDIKDIHVRKRKFNEVEIPRVLRELRNISDTKPYKRAPKPTMDFDIFDEEPTERKKLRKYPTTDSIYRSVLKAQREYDELVAKGEMIDTILREYGFSEEVLQQKHKKPLKLYRSKQKEAERIEDVPHPIVRTVPDVPVQDGPVFPEFFSENANMDYARTKNAARNNVYLID